MRNIKVLFIDDDLGILESVRIFLEDEGFDVEVSACGDTVLELANRKDKPDVILLDILVSGSDGRELTRYLKTHNSLKHIPVVLISAHPVLSITPTKWGNDAFLEKPFDIYSLTGIIRKLLK